MAPDDSIRIYIDAVPIDVHQHHLTGTQLRELLNPPADHVWLDVADAQDQPVAATERVMIQRDMRFFTDRPRTIYIDKVPYQVNTAVLTESELRALPTPAISEDFRIWRDIPDAQDEPIGAGEVVRVAEGDRFFTAPRHHRDIHITINRRQVTLSGPRQTGLSIKEAAIAQGVPIQLDFLLSRKQGPKFWPVGDHDEVRAHNGEEFRANDGDDNS
ncbi:hypothetical protein QWI29_03990 [Mycolicibacterium neoaurum]|uniref:multiubiquitin domain-containing protein n=1 Tax=Mycolicibacterium neoaurum TaxID=1795 RepID=UPI002670D96A|nr:multiubiquitin domain-containing protein [Mycolicibacterium neoaurum]MDO3399179.1 hypothetical protein [Mycolicibacterium neoaurum]